MASNMESVGWSTAGAAQPSASTAPRLGSARPLLARRAASSPQGGDAATAAAEVGHHLETQTELRLQVDAGSGRTIFQVVQPSTGEVVLQVPSEEVIGMSRRVREMESQPGGPGTLLDREG